MKMSAIATKGSPIALRVASNNKISPSAPIINSEGITNDPNSIFAKIH